jgi:hypothetical protein
LARIEATLSTQQNLSASERSLIPHAWFDSNDLAVLVASMRVFTGLGDPDDIGDLSWAITRSRRASTTRPGATANGGAPPRRRGVIE